MPLLLSEEVQFFTQTLCSLFLFFGVSSVNHGEPNRRWRVRVPFRVRQPLLLRGPRRSSAGGAEQPPRLPVRPLRRANLWHLLHLPSQPQPLQVLLRLFIQLNILNHFEVNNLLSKNEKTGRLANSTENSDQ